ncbi:MAG: D-aminoacyl-tRNA deacylase [Nitriliruptoraceae bacterium]
MRALIQRVHEASVHSATQRGEETDLTGSIGQGLVAFVGVTHEDDEAQAVRLAEKIFNLRVFADDDGAMNRSCGEVGGGVLVVSQFTLYADTRKGRRPSYLHAALPDHAEPLVSRVAQRLVELGATVAEGRFQTHMDVSLVNDGPVTIMLEV